MVRLLLRHRRLFQSTLPARGATGVPKCMMYRYAFQSTLPARGATWTTLSISPRRRFQSTLPARGATPQDIKTKNIKADFNPRSPHGERQNGFCTISAKPRISIHAPRTGSDPPFDYNRINAYISIHAPRTGSDSAPAFAPDAAEHFNPRSPHGERPEDDIEDSRLWVFQSTLPARGATRNSPLSPSLGKFQSTLPARGATLRSILMMTLILFQSTLPARGATTRRRSQQCGQAPFQSTLPARGATLHHCLLLMELLHFNPRSPHGERPAHTTSISGLNDFNPRSPHGERLVPLSVSQ